MSKADLIPTINKLIGIRLLSIYNSLFMKDMKWIFVISKKSIKIMNSK